MQMDPMDNAPLQHPTYDQYEIYSSEESERLAVGSEYIPGSLIIDVLDESGVPVLAPLPSSNDALILDNKSGGKMRVKSETLSGTLEILIPDDGVVAIVPRTPGAKATVLTTVLVRKRIRIIGSYRYYIVRVAANSGDGDVIAANPYPASGRFSIDLKGDLS